MKRYEATVRWDHKGKYPKSAFVIVTGTSFATAAQRAIREVKRNAPGSMRETDGASVLVSMVLVTKVKNMKEVD